MLNQTSVGVRVAVVAALFGVLSAGQAAAEGTKDDLQVTLGGGVISHPKYPGSDKFHTFAFPLINASYGRFFIGDQGAGLAGIGMNLYRDYRWTLGAAVGPDPIKPRTESDDSRLRGLGDIQRTVRAAVLASYSYEWFTVRSSVSSDVNNKKQGTLVRLEALARYAPMERLMLHAGPSATWATRQYTQTFYGIDGGQSARSGSPEFSPQGGLERLQFTLGADYQIDQHWGLGMRVFAASVKGDAAASPITVDKSQNSFGIFTAYRL